MNPALIQPRSINAGKIYDLIRGSVCDYRSLVQQYRSWLVQYVIAQKNDQKREREGRRSFFHT